MEFVGFYSSSTTSQTGCVKKFLTTERKDLAFPVQYHRECDLCGVTHPFRLERTTTVGTPRQRTQVRTYCEQQRIEMDVKLL